MSETARALHQLIENRRAAVGIVGLGYVGLPLAVAFGKAGFRVLGLDSDPARVARLRNGESPVEDVSSGALAELLRAGRLTVSDQADVLAQADAILICVPTPLSKSKEPDVSHVVAAADAVARILHAGQLVILESTTYPGTTEEVLLPRFEARGLAVGREFFLAFSPERIDPGNKRYDLSRIPKVVGGVTPVCAELARVLYGQIIEQVVPVSSPQVAEMVKLFENVFRTVNIALVNELALMCRRLGLSVWEVIEAAATKPFGYMPFYPGPGIGGHCLGPEEWIYCCRGELVWPERVAEVWDATMRAGGQVERVGGVEVLARPPLQVLGISSDGQVRWDNVAALFRRVTDSDLISVATSDGREVQVTDRHPMLILSEGRLQVKEAGSLTPGDLVPTFAGVAPAGNETGNPRLDVISALSPEQLRKTRVRIIDGSWREHERALARAHAGSVRDFLRDEAVPLDLYLRLETDASVPNLRQRLLLMTGRGPSWSSLSAVLELTPEFARLVGYYLSEGCVTEDSSLRVRFVFHADEAEYIDDVIGILHGLGLRVSQYKDRQFQSIQIKVSSALFGALIRDGLGCGRNSYDMRIPPVLLGASAEHRLALLTGLLRGDGDVWVRTGFQTYRKRGRLYRHHAGRGCVGYFSVSERLARGVVCLMQSLGFAPRVSRRKSQAGLRIRLYGATSMDRLAPLLDGEKGRRLAELSQSRRRRPASRVVREIDRFTLVPVASVRRVPGPAVVYSVETEETHTFAAGFGNFVHNCIPTDPYYLSWKARLAGYEPKFITFADEINSQMPSYVVQLGADALNDRGKPVRGSRVLVLGVAYKPGVADTRESPAVEILELLRAKGAEIAYVDPHVPEFAFGRERLTSLPWETVDLSAWDLVLILTNHPEFDPKRVVREATLVLDTRNATGTEPGPLPHVIRL